MLKINDNFQKLPASYLFSTIAKKVNDFTAANPEAKIIRMGIGDVTRPIIPAATEAMHKAVDEMANIETFRGYGPEQGYDFLRNAICDNDYKALGLEIAADEIFVSDGAKSDCGNIGDLFDVDNVVAVCDPVYPVYVDSNVMGGRLGEYVDNCWTKLVYLPCTAENNFKPALPETTPDIIYLCFPYNPTGTTLTTDELKVWVDYAKANDAIIIYDSAYEAYIVEENIPHSIYEVEGARDCAIEIRSFSKTAGFTGTRCGYTVVPKTVVYGGASIRDMWNRRQCTKFNGVPYIVQRGAEALYTAEGKAQVKEVIAYYLNNAKVLKEGLEACGVEVYGGVNSPYVWAKCPAGIDSWAFFEKLLNEAHVVTTPGAGFGNAGEGYIRLTGFGDAAATAEAIERIKKVL